MKIADSPTDTVRKAVISGIAHGIKQLLRSFLTKVDIEKDLIVFWSRRRLFGINSALLYMKTVNEHSIIPILRAYGAQVGNGCVVETAITFHNCADFSGLHIMDNCHIGKNCFFDMRDTITIEENATVSMGTYLITHQDLGRSALSSIYPTKNKGIRIKNDAYIGANTIVLMGVTVGECSIVAAGSTVKENIADYTLAGGVPARAIRQIDIKAVVKQHDSKAG